MTHLASRPWQFRNPVEVQFGAGARQGLVARLKGQRLLCVTTRRGRAQLLADPHLGALAAGELSFVDSVQANPGLAETQAEIDRLAGTRFDAILAFGGGSAMDAAKALVAGLAEGLVSRNLARLIAQPTELIDRPLIALHAVTTTSGTGAEVTPFATIWDHARRKKLSLASPRLFPITATVDPELTYGLPALATLSTGLDAMNQAFESVWNRNRSPLTLAMAARAIVLSFEALPRLKADLEDQDARAAIAEASLLAGLCISQTRTALCHSISYPVTAHFGMPHGLACALSMAAVARAVLAGAPEGLEEVAGLAGLGSGAALVARLEAVLERVDLRGLAGRWLPGEAAALLALRSEMVTPGRADNFVLPVEEALLAQILEASLGGRKG